MESIFNTIISHGHPRAVIGTALYGLAVQYTLTAQNGRHQQLLDYLQDMLPLVAESLVNTAELRNWVRSWDRGRGRDEPEFRHVLNQTISEARSYLESIPAYLDQPREDYYRFVGALNPSTKGSAVATVCAAVYMYIRDGEQPEQAIVESANLLGSDTDTISVFLGSLLGGRYGLGAIPARLSAGLQDHAYIQRIATRLHAVASGEAYEEAERILPLNKLDSYFQILAWEVALHEMFWDALATGDRVYHPVLGSGRIVDKKVVSLARQDYIAKLVRIAFESGQTCVFHSRLKSDDVMESLSEELEKTVEASLQGTSPR